MYGLEHYPKPFDERPENSPNRFVNDAVKNDYDNFLDAAWRTIMRMNLLVESNPNFARAKERTINGLPLFDFGEFIVGLKQTDRTNLGVEGYLLTPAIGYTFANNGLSWVPTDNRIIFEMAFSAGCKSKNLGDNLSFGNILSFEDMKARTPLLRQINPLSESLKLYELVNNS